MYRSEAYVTVQRVDVYAGGEAFACDCGLVADETVFPVDPHPGNHCEVCPVRGLSVRHCYGIDASRHLWTLEGQGQLDVAELAGFFWPCRRNRYGSARASGSHL